MPDAIILDTQAGDVSAELAHRGVAPATPVHEVVELLEPLQPSAAVAQEGGAFEWLHDEPELYSDADLLPR